jgi:hypothetical protein
VRQAFILKKSLYYDYDYTQGDIMTTGKKYLLPLLFLGFIFFGISAYLESVPEDKSVRIYKEIGKYSPYIIDKRFGGLRIMSKTDKEFKEEPSNKEVFHRLDELEKQWGKTHLSVENSTLNVLDDTNATVATIAIKDPNERAFLKSFYGL